MFLLYLIVTLAVGYLLIVLFMYVAQTGLIFPTYLASFAEIDLPSSAQRLRVSGADGSEERLTWLSSKPPASRSHSVA